MNQLLQNAIKHWHYVAPLASAPRDDVALATQIALLDELLDIIGHDESHSLMGLADILSHNIAEYEAMHLTENTTTGVNALKFLMQAHHLRQIDLPEIGSQGIVSEILNGKRTLNMRQIKALAKRFRVSIETFIDAS